MGQARTRMYRKGVLEAENFPVADVSDYLEEPDTVVWVDFCAPTKAARRARGRAGPARARRRRHARPPSAPEARPLRHPPVPVLPRRTRQRRRGGLEEIEIDAFIDSRWLITVRKDDRFLDGPRTPALGPLTRPRDARGQLPAVRAARRRRRQLLRRRPGVRRLLRPGQRRDLRRTAARPRSSSATGSKCAAHWCDSTVSPYPSARRSAASCAASTAVVSGELYPYYQDVYDHILRVSESTDSLRDLVSTIVETNLSLRDYRQNQIVKKVTSWAAIIAVPTLITGYYGMNVPYPGFGRHWGVVTSAALIVVISGAPLPAIPPPGLALTRGHAQRERWCSERAVMHEVCSATIEEPSALP